MYDSMSSKWSIRIYQKMTEDFLARLQFSKHVFASKTAEYGCNLHKSSDVYQMCRICCLHIEIVLPSPCIHAFRRLDFCVLQGLLLGGKPEASLSIPADPGVVTELIGAGERFCPVAHG